VSKAELQSLLSAAAVRERAHEMLELALAGAVEGWTVDLSRLDEAADRTVAVTRERFPDLDIPFHARGRHFVAGAPKLPEGDAAERARAAFDLNILSVLLDAGSGPGWRYSEGAETYTRSEGLAVASQRMFERGTFAAAGESPLRADGMALAELAPDALAQGFQAGEGNPLVGLEGRASCCAGSGRQIEARPDLFAGRPAGCSTCWRRGPSGAASPRRDPRAGARGAGADLGGRLTWTACRSAIAGGIRRSGAGDASDGLVPLHKLSQWLSYSLIEPLQEAGIEVVEIDGLTGLAEYRNGGCSSMPACWC
jgi:hypothetical protein